MRALSYAFQEALVSMRRGGRSAVISVVTIAIAFLTLGAFLLISHNLRRVAEQWAEAAEMSVYLEEGLDEAGRAALTTELQQQASVAGVEYVSKDSALERFRQDFPELADVATGDNPFPASLEVRLRSDASVDAAALAASLAASLADREGVADVRYDQQWLTRLLGAIATIRIGGLIVAAVLVLGAAFTVAAVVRLSLESRHAELDIMQLVGAPSVFVRGPFVAEGTLLGGLGAIVSMLALWGLYVGLRTRIEEALAGLVRVASLAFLPASDVLLVIGAGLLVGAAAGVIASRVAR
jgi:cell division transport system permease protein